MASSICLRATVFQNPEWTLWTHCISPRFLDLGTIWRWVVSFIPLPLYSRRKNPLYSLDRRSGGPQGRSGWYEEVKFLYLWSCDPQPVAMHTRYRSEIGVLNILFLSRKSPAILISRRCNTWGTGSLSAFRWSEGDTYSVGSLRKI
jgi:hypothetical protein